MTGGGPQCRPPSAAGHRLDPAAPSPVRLYRPRHLSIPPRPAIPRAQHSVSPGSAPLPGDPARRRPGQQLNRERHIVPKISAGQAAGSRISPCAHSRPRRCTSGVARGVTPAAIGIPPPQARYQALGHACRSCSMSFSCLGKPSPTRTRSGAAATTAATVCRTPSAVRSKPNGGESVPTTRKSGDRKRSASAALSGTPAAPPRMNTDRPSAAAAALSESTRRGSGHAFRQYLATGPCRPAPEASRPRPRVTLRPTSSARSGFRLASRATSTFTVMMDPPRPASTLPGLRRLLRAPSVHQTRSFPPAPWTGPGSLSVMSYLSLLPVTS